MKRRRSLLALLFIASACSVSDTTAPSTLTASRAYTGDTHNGANVPGSGGNAGATPSAGSHTALACSVPKALTGSAEIGPNGGILDVGPHRLIVPPGALDKKVVLSGTVPTGNTMMIDFAPHGLQFKKPAGLILDASACAGAPNVVYLDEQGNIAQRITAVFANWWHVIAAPIDHFSSYMVDV